MDINQNNSPSENETWNRFEREHRRGRLYGGIFIVLIGTSFLLRELGVIIPDWVFTWQMLLITIGLFMGLKHSFRSFGWLIMILIGSSFMLKEFAPWLEFGRFAWPVSIIIVGLFMLFKPKRNYCGDRADWREQRKAWKKSHLQNWKSESEKYNDEDYMDFNTVFGSLNKKIISKTFRGGEVNVVFGGAEINLTQADFQGKIELEINAVFGGVRLILPPNWNIKSEVAAVMGSVEDKRPLTTEINSDPEKVLILRGNAVFGGIEIQSFA